MFEHQPFTGPSPRRESLRPMSRPPISAKVSVRTIMTVTGWAACLAVWFGMMVVIALFGDGSPMAYTALMALFLGGVMVAVFALVVMPIIRSKHDP